MHWILISAAAGLVACFVVGRWEQWIVRQVVVKSAEKLSIPLHQVEVQIGWAWPLSKNLSITAVVENPADADRMDLVVENVSSWLDDRWA